MKGNKNKNKNFSFWSVVRVASLLNQASGSLADLVSLADCLELCPSTRCPAAKSPCPTASLRSRQHDNDGTRNAGDDQPRHNGNVSERRVRQFVHQDAAGRLQAVRLVETDVRTVALRYRSRADSFGRTVPIRGQAAISLKRRQEPLHPQQASFHGGGFLDTNGFFRWLQPHALNVPSSSRNCYSMR
ncbi:hypothetical protein HPB51_007954 [Rhipicephalus microplus]|uniref:Uncharacterized protein n=1 Tax=Rhipicephalus microplus TaxID=6941 RepID=A0A9J6EMX7_RHIMP|nr:hypothetical protein HPB51_007954 [Rhipicephalus microplus]